jgi:hypothetical protein
MKRDYKSIALLIVVSVLLFVSMYYSYKNNSLMAQSNQEHFTMVPFRPQLEGPYGLGFQSKYEPVPLFVNFHPPLMGSDFKLNSFIRRMKMESNTPTLTNGNKLTLPIEQMSVGPSRNPIFLVPDIGASRILVRWAKPSTLGAKKIDAYGAFQESTKWSCKDTEPNWQLLWFPKDKTGLSRYCWQELIKTSLSSDKMNVINDPNTNTLVDTMGSMNFETDIYNTFIEAMYAMSYLQGSSLFGASYDHRLIAGEKMFAEWSKSLRLLIENSVKFNERRALLIGHGFGSLLINKFLVSADQTWKDTYIAAFITISGAIGPVPKALRVLLSGDILPDQEDQDLIRNANLNASALHAMLPMSTDTDPIISYNQEVYSPKDIPKILELAASELYDADLPDVYKLAENFNKNSANAPNVPVNIFIGIDTDTEVKYYYDDLIHDPKNITYTNGDGTVPLSTLMRPKEWASQQSQLVTFKAYPRADHSKILKLFEPMSDLMNLIKVYNE